MLDDPKRLLPAVDWRLRAMAKAVAADFRRRTGRGLRIRSGVRSCDEQNRIYAQGRTAPGPIVTGAPGCRSWHVTGRALDMDPYDLATGKVEPNGNHEHYRLLGALWKAEGGVWGGDFNIYDPGHIEWRPGLSIDQICPIGTTCDQFKVYSKMPLWILAGAGVAVASLTLGLMWAVRRE